MDIQEASKLLLSQMSAKILSEKKGLCLGCLKESKIEDIASLGLYVPKKPAITGKIRLVAYPVCVNCLKLPVDILTSRVEGNIIRDGIMLDPRPLSPGIHT